MTLPGYRETKLADPFEIYLGPIFEIGEKPNRRFAMKIDERHVKGRAGSRCTRGRDGRHDHELVRREESARHDRREFGVVVDEQDFHERS